MDSPDCARCGATYDLGDRELASHGMCWPCAGGARMSGRWEDVPEARESAVLRGDERVLGAIIYVAVGWCAIALLDQDTVADSVVHPTREGAMRAVEERNARAVLG